MSEKQFTAEDVASLQSLHDQYVEMALHPERTPWDQGVWDRLVYRTLGAVPHLLRIAAASASGCGDGWMPIETAPKDGTLVWAYTAEREGLPAFQSACAYHPDAGWCTDELRYVTHWRPMRDVWLPERNYVQALASTPPPPADLKVEAVAWRAKYDGLWAFTEGSEGPTAEDRAACEKTWPDFVAESLYTKDALSAAHAAGKAEGGAEWRTKAEDLGQALAALEAQCQPVASIEKLLADNIELSEGRWYVLPEGLKAGIYAIRATARAEALEEAKQAARAAGEEACKGFVLTGPAGIVMRMLAAISALASTPPAPREEPTAIITDRVHARLAVAVSKEGRTDHIGTYNHGMAEAFREVLAMLAETNASPARGAANG